MRFTIEDANGVTGRDVEPDAVIVAGYTGRDRELVQHHIDELAAIGIPPPATRARRTGCCRRGWR